MNNKDRILSQLTGLPDDVTIFDYDINRDKSIIRLYVTWNEPMGEDRICPACNGINCVKKDNGSNQTMRHTPSGLMNVLITFHKPRFKCRDCNRSFYMKPWWADTDMSITIHLFYMIYRLLITTTLNLTDIARRTNSTPSIVLNVMKRIHLVKPSLPHSLGIDEFHGSTGSYNPDRNRYDVDKYHCILTDTDNSVVYDILPKATYNYLHSYFMHYDTSIRSRVQFISMDMRSGFSRIARECFPKSRVCIDPFHVVKLLTEAISQIRVDEWRRLHSYYLSYVDQADKTPCPDDDEKAMKAMLESDYKLVKNSQKLLITSPYNKNTFWALNPDIRKERLDKLFKLAPALKQPYLALMEFYDVTNCSDSKSRHSLFMEWIKKWLKCDCPKIQGAAKSISKRKGGIERAWKYHKSNSVTEGLNKKIKDIKRSGFGMHDFENFRKRILLSIGYDHYVDETYSIHKVRLDADTKGGDHNAR